ncbi:PDDEXK nuclease domain-containing protein [Limnospira fusiformis]|uniref:PDDEXK nuclease domain-containing protein n=1 Tax=Limnospira fusiformis TaxID=54297 RepID=UPI003F6C6EDE
MSCKTVEAQEREIERALVKHVTQFLLELGAGFAFVGRQVLLQVPMLILKGGLISLYVDSLPGYPPPTAIVLALNHTLPP